MQRETNDLVSMLGIISTATFPFISPHLIFHASHSSHLFPSLHPLLICVYTLKVFIVGVAAAQRSEPASLCEVLPQGWIYPSVCSKTAPPAQRITLP